MKGTQGRQERLAEPDGPILVECQSISSESNFLRLQETMVLHTPLATTFTYSEQPHTASDPSHKSLSPLLIVISYLEGFLLSSCNTISRPCGEASPSPVCSASPHCLQYHGAASVGLY